MPAHSLPFALPGLRLRLWVMLASYFGKDDIVEGFHISSSGLSGWRHTLRLRRVRCLYVIVATHQLVSPRTVVRVGVSISVSHEARMTSAISLAGALETAVRSLSAPLGCLAVTLIVACSGGPLTPYRAPLFAQTYLIRLCSPKSLIRCIILALVSVESKQ